MKNLFQTSAEPLSKKLLGEFLAIFFKNEEILVDKKVPHTRFKVDYRIESLNLIVEFEDPKVFTNPKYTIRSEITEQTLESMEYFVVRIPYFIQLNSENIKHYFAKFLHLIDKKECIVNDFTSYPHGFIDSRSVLPAAFCSMGHLRYTNHLNKATDNVFADTNESLLSQMLEHGDVGTVFNLDNPNTFEFLAFIFYQSNQFDDLPHEYISSLEEEFEWLCNYYNYSLDDWKVDNILHHHSHEHEHGHDHDHGDEEEEIIYN